MSWQAGNGWKRREAGEFILLSLRLKPRYKEWECNKGKAVQLVSTAHINPADLSVALPGDHKN